MTFSGGMGTERAVHALAEIGELIESGRFSLVVPRRSRSIRSPRHIGSARPGTSAASSCCSSTDVAPRARRAGDRRPAGAVGERSGSRSAPTGTVRLGGVTLRLGAAGEGITGWTLRGIETTDAIETADASTTTVRRRPPTPVVDTPPTPVIDESVDRVAAGADPSEHPNGAIALDHVVILTPDFDRTAAALADRGMPLRREAERNGARQGFRRLGPAIMEIVQAPDGDTRFWGLVVIVSDLDALRERLGDDLGEPRPAVQPGRRIATLRRSAGLGPAVAFMDPEPD